MFVSNSQDKNPPHSSYDLALSPVLTLLIKVISFQIAVHRQLFMSAFFFAATNAKPIATNRPG